jgi:hypothetical protein
MVRAIILTLAFVLTCPLALCAEKLRVPSDEALKGPLNVIKEVHGEEHANAKTDEQLQALAKKLFSGASQTDDRIERFALLRVARDIAAQGCDGQTAFQIIDEMDTVYQVDAVVMKASVLYALTKKARLPAERKSIAEQALVLVDLAVARDDFGTATKLANMAMDEARRTRDAGLVKTVTARRKDLEKLVKAYTEVTSAVDKLKEAPTDPDANLVVGKYRCLIKGDWESGLPMLALGSDAALKGLAMKELGEVAKPDEQVALGDSWWELAAKEDGIQQRRLRQRAAYWYRTAIPNLTGLAEARVRKRLAEVPAGTPTRPATISDQYLRHLLVTNKWRQDYYSVRYGKRCSIWLTFNADGSAFNLKKAKKTDSNWQVDNAILEAQKHRYRFDAELRRWENLENSAENPGRDDFIILLGSR